MTDWQVLAVFVSLVFVTLFYLAWRNETRQKEEKKLKLEEDKMRLKAAVLLVVKKQLKDDDKCGKVIRNEISFKACESYTTIELRDNKTGADHKLRVPETLWKILQWMTLRGNSQTKQEALMIEQKKSKSGAFYEHNSTSRRIEALLKIAHKTPEERKKALYDIDQQIKESEPKLTNQLLKYGQRLINREPLPKQPVKPATPPDPQDEPVRSTS